MTEKTPEDEAFEDIERKQFKPDFEFELNPYEKMVRNKTLDEVADKLEAEFKIPFAQDTVASFAAYIREMKR